MDSEKIGRLILQLRKEKKLTQQQVAKELNISNKTVSKWECGLGCPDADLWEKLSEVLGADIFKLLQGELKPNKTDVGKIDRVRFYVCPTCGNILLSTGDAAISCCGRLLSPLKPIPCAPGHPGYPQHKVMVEQIETDYYVTLSHEMKKDHYIAFAAYVCDDRILLNRLYPEQSPEFRLPMMRGGGNLYVYCINHGLQKFSNILK